MNAVGGDFDIAGLSFATMLDTSARIAVVAGRDVRRNECDKKRTEQAEARTRESNQSERIWRAGSPLFGRSADTAARAG